MFWKKEKPKKEVKERKKREVKQEDRIITFNVSDDCFERAEKLSRLTGIINYREFSDSVARGVQAYMKLDKIKNENEQKPKAKPKKKKE